MQRKSAMNKPLEAFTTGEVAAFCGVNFRTIIRWVEKGYLDAYQLPGRGDKRIPRDSLIKFLGENSMPIPEALQSNSNRVLVVEDMPEMAEAISRVLTRAGFITKIAKNGFEAGELLRSFNPALMTLDIRMPGLSGFDVLRYTKSQEDFKHLKIIVVSAQRAAELEKAVEEGADLAIGKPYDNKELVNAVKRLISID